MGGSIAVIDYLTTTHSIVVVVVVDLMFIEGVFRESVKVSLM